jgi:hypothetical protein
MSNSAKLTPLMAMPSTHLVCGKPIAVAEDRTASALGSQTQIVSVELRRLRPHLLIDLRRVVRGDRREQ